VKGTTRRIFKTSYSLLGTWPATASSLFVWHRFNKETNMQLCLTQWLANAAAKSDIERKEPEILSHLALAANAF